MKKALLFAASVLAAVFTTASCTKDNYVDPNRDLVAILLPSGELNPRWSEDAALLQESFTRYDYRVKLLFAPETNEGPAIQVEQLKEVIDEGISHIVIVPVDDIVIAESGVLDNKDRLDIICYDRMIRNCDAVDYYIGCNPTSIGSLQGHFILQHFKASGKSPMTIELFAGPANDDNAKRFFDGSNNIISPYIENGSLVVPSRKKSFDEVSLPSWTTEDAKAEMASRLKSTGVMPDCVLAANDMIADGVIQAIREFGFKGRYPVITGLDNVSVARKNILYGYQTMTIDKELAPLADYTALVVHGVITGLPIKTSFSTNNGAKDIPAFYSSISLVTYDDLKN